MSDAPNPEDLLQPRGDLTILQARRLLAGTSGPRGTAAPEDPIDDLLEWLGVDAQRAETLTGDDDPGDAPSLRDLKEVGFLGSTVASYLLELAPGSIGDAFDIEQLLARSAEELAALRVSDLAAACEPVLRDQQCWTEDLAVGGARRAWLEEVVELSRVGAETLHDVCDLARAFLFDQIAYEADAVREHLIEDPLRSSRWVRTARAAIEQVETWTMAGIKKELHAAADRIGVNAPDLAGPVRVALTGRGSGPVVCRIVLLQGKDRALRLLDALLAFLDHDPLVQQTRRASEGLIPPPR